LFEIYQPFAVADVSEAPGRKRLTSLSDIHVLVVDDNAQMRILLRCLLRAGGIFNVSETETAAQALDVMRAAPVDLIVLDWKMAPTDGLAFTRMLRWSEDSPNAYAPVLMLTAHTEASRVAAARDAGVTGFVKKPISARILFERIASALTDARMFVRCGDFRGPDRRRGQDPNYAGPFRRTADKADETVDVDDVRWRA
jgi:CheY-like chemotaxis protein